MLDIKLRNCRILDGTGAPWFHGEVGVQHGKITVVRHRIEEEATKVVNLHDQILCPGFIDMHTHSDLRVFISPEDEAKTRQGITTALVGQDGLSVAPLTEKAKPVMKKRLLGLNGAYENWNWNTVGEYLSAVDKASPGTNVAMLVPHGAVRASIVGWEGRPATDDEIAKMVDMVGTAMQEGAFGFSTGLIYPPCLYAEEKELVALAKEAARHGGFFVVHMRNEQDHIADSIKEVVRICTEAGCPLHISHLKIAGRKNWGRSAEILGMIDAARGDGLEVTFDQYPYTAGSTMLDALIPPVFHKNGQEALLKDLDDVSVRQEIRDMIEGRKGPVWENWIASCGWDGIFINSVVTDTNRWMEGKSLAEISSDESKNPVDTLCDLLVNEKGMVTMTVFYGSEDDVQAILKHESMLFCSDSIVGGKPHPRAFGSTARILGRYARDEGVLSLPQAIRRMTSGPAARLRLQDRGLVREGMTADLVAFSPELIVEQGTYKAPNQFPQGISLTMVAGEITLRDGVMTGARPGRGLRS